MLSKIIARIIASCLYTGYFPIASGTVGSLFALIIYWFMPLRQGLTWPMITIGLFFIGVYCSTQAEQDWDHDDGKIVIDEAVGMLVAVIAVPKTLVMLAIAFFAFRFFDIIKLAPARQMERLPKGWGIMLDDVVAGIYANVTTLFLRILFFKCG